MSKELNLIHVMNQIHNLLLYLEQKEQYTPISGSNRWFLHYLTDGRKFRVVNGFLDKNQGMQVLGTSSANFDKKEHRHALKVMHRFLRQGADSKAMSNLVARELAEHGIIHDI